MDDLRNPTIGGAGRVYRQCVWGWQGWPNPDTERCQDRAVDAIFTGGIGGHHFIAYLCGPHCDAIWQRGSGGTDG